VTDRRTDRQTELP